MESRDLVSAQWAQAIVVAIIVPMMTRIRVMLVIVQRIPANVITKNYSERDQRGPPPTAMPVILTARAPGPIVVVVNPATVVIWRPAPGLQAHPGPAIRWNPGPITITIGSPIVVSIDGAGVRVPDPAIIFGVGPIAVGIQIFTTPNITIVILSVVTHPLGQIALAFLDPIIPRVRSVACDKLPITRVVAIDHKFRSASSTQLKTGGLRIDPRPATIARAEAHLTIARHVNAIETFFLGGKCGFRRVNFKILMIAIKFCQSYRSPTVSSKFRRT